MAHFYYHHQAHAFPTAPVFASPHRTRIHPHPRPAPVAHAHPSSSVPRHRKPPRSPSTAQPTTLIMPTLDPLIAYHTRPPLEFDLSLSPAHIILEQSAGSSSYTNLTPRHLSAPAVTPPQSFLRITCPMLRWPIDVYPATHGGSGVVTVGDVLEAIYRGLRQLVSGSDWRSASPEMQAGVRTAYKRRCRRQHSHAERVYEESRGLRRIDWLMKNTLFQGLRPGKSPDHWEMHVCTGEKTVKFAV